MIISYANLTNRDKWRYVPLKIFTGYILFTLFLNMFGPWEFLNYNKSIVFIYMSVFLAAVMATYSHFSKDTRPIKKKENIVDQSKQIGIIQVIILAGFFTIGLMLLIKIVEEGVPNFNNVFQQMAIAYTDKENVREKFSISAWIFSYFSFFYIATLVLGTLYFEGIRKKYKVLYVLTMLFSLSYHVLYIGNQKAIGDILIYIFSAVFIKFVQSGRKVRPKTIVIVLVATVATFLMFSYVIQTRISLWQGSYMSINSAARINTNHWMLYLLDERIKMGAGIFIFYISHGYFGLSLALEQPFVWSMGYGSSFEIKNILNRFYYISDQSIGAYPVRVELSNGWAAYSNWHTIFPWLASDFSFVGAIIFICLFIAIYASCWKRILNWGHWSNVLVFAQINVMLLYIPANNQLFQTRSSIVATLIIFALWIYQEKLRKN